MRRPMLMMLPGCCLLGCLISTAAEPESAEVVLGKYRAASIPASMHARIRVVATNSAEEGVQESLIEMFCRKKDEFFLRYLEPERQRGTAILKTGDEVWMILPNMTKPTKMSKRSLVTSMDMMRIGYLMSMGNPEDYAATITGSEDVDGVPCHILDLKASGHNSPFDRAKIWVRSKDYMGGKAEYYTRSGKLMLTIVNDKFKSVKGVCYPAETTIVNPLLKGEKTVVAFEEVEFDGEMPEELFVRENLSKSAAN
ncbi:MAG: outer membrane lipoprotein-sorting protein [bacterium]